MRINLFSLILLITFCYACDSKIVYDQYQTLPNEWHKDSVLKFTINPLDTINHYNLFLNIRNNNDYAFNNLFLITTMQFPNGKTITDTLEYKMANPKGELLGKGFSDIKENKLWYKENIRFLEKGNYLFNIQHAMRKNGNVLGVINLKGISEVGLRIEKNMKE